MSERKKFGVRSNGDLTLHRQDPANMLRTENQVLPHDGFKPEAVMVKSPIQIQGMGTPTFRLAKPPAWAEAGDMPCVPPSHGASRPATEHRSTLAVPTTGYDLRRKFMDKWDTGSEIEAQALCAGCPVREECLAAAIEEEHGLSANNRYLVRGGLTPSGRVQLEQQEAS